MALFHLLKGKHDLKTSTDYGTDSFWPNKRETWPFRGKYLGMPQENQTICSALNITKVFKIELLGNQYWRHTYITIEFKSATVFSYKNFS